MTAVQGTFASTGSVEQYLDIGDVVEYQFPSVPDPNLSDVAITLRGVLTCEVQPLPPIPIQYWTFFAVNLNGQYIIGVANATDGSGIGYIWLSNDYGANWINQEIPGSGNWNSCAISSNGSHLAACADGGFIWTSTDYGLTWLKATAVGSDTWRAVIMSSDGDNLTVINNTGTVWNSTNGGVSWTNQSGISVTRIYMMAADASGLKLITGDSGVSGGLIYQSLNGGTSWSVPGAAPTGQTGSVASSSDGSRLEVIFDTSQNVIQQSVDGGTTWSTISHVGEPYIEGDGNGGLKSSDSGAILIGVNETFDFYASSDYGVTWNLKLHDNNGLSPCGISRDGSLFVVGNSIYNGNIRVSRDGGSSWSTVVL